MDVIVYETLAGLVLYGLSRLMPTPGGEIAEKERALMPRMDWPSRVAYCKYKYWLRSGRPEALECGIAVDAVDGRVHLCMRRGGKLVEKDYACRDIREWGYRVEAFEEFRGVGPHTVGDALRIASENAKRERDADSSTGFWVAVRDVDNPVWFIRFRVRRKDLVDPEDQTKFELQKWMEILQQNVNERDWSKEPTSNA